MKRSSLRLLPALCVCVVVASAFVAVSASASSGITKVSLAGTGAPQTGAFSPSGSGDVTQAEFPQQEDEATPAPFAGSIVDRSLSRGVGNGVAVTSGKKAKSNPQFNTGFEGLNLYQQRYARGGNQFTVEPPDQGLCVGNGYVVEAVNDVINVYNTSGQSVLPDNTADEHRRRVPAEREPRRRPELVLRLRAGDQPHDGSARPRASPTRAASTTRRRSASSSSC